MLIFYTPPGNKLQEETRWVGMLDSELTESAKNSITDINLTVRANRAYTASTTHMVEYCNMILESGEVIQIPELIDRSMGTLTGRPYRETMEEFPRRNWLGWQRSYFTAPPGGESLFDISDRVMTAFRTKILPMEQHETVLIVAAPDVLRVLIGTLSNHKETDIPKIVMEPNVSYVIRNHPLA